MRHVNENKNMNYVPFATRIRHLRRLQTISFVPTLKTSLREKGACSVVVSASNWQADGLGLIRADVAADLIYLI